MSEKQVNDIMDAIMLPWGFFIPIVLGTLIGCYYGASNKSKVKIYLYTFIGTLAGALGSVALAVVLLSVLGFYAMLAMIPSPIVLSIILFLVLLPKASVFVRIVGDEILYFSKDFLSAFRVKRRERKLKKNGWVVEESSDDDRESFTS